MNWFNLALLSASIMGVVSILDSHLLSKRMPGLRAFLLPVAIIHLAFGSLLFVLFPLSEDIDIWPVLVAAISGIIRTGAVIIMLYSLKKEEVSRVIPVVYSYPILVAIMAMPLLGESLTRLEWLAIVIVVIGAVMVSVKRSPSGSAKLPAKLLFLLFGSSLLFAAADITSKYALAYISFWNMFWISAFCMSGIFLLLSLRPRILNQLINMKKKSSAMGILAIDEALALAGILLSFWALEGGPVSLVSTIISSRPMFVLIFAFIISRLAPMFLKWDSGNGILAIRLVATAMIVGGITIIHLL